VRHFNTVIAAYLIKYRLICTVIVTEGFFEDHKAIPFGQSIFIQYITLCRIWQAEKRILSEECNFSAANERFLIELTGSSQMPEIVVL
jgi:hypothetical protein